MLLDKEPGRVSVVQIDIQVPVFEVAVEDRSHSELGRLGMGRRYPMQEEDRTAAAVDTSQADQAVDMPDTVSRTTRHMLVRDMVAVRMAVLETV